MVQFSDTDGTPSGAAHLHNNQGIHHHSYIRMHHTSHPHHHHHHDAIDPPMSPQHHPNNNNNTVSQNNNNNNNTEQVFYNLHYKASIFYLRHTSRRVRAFLELFWMGLAVSGFAALICLHGAFVYRGNPHFAAGNGGNSQSSSSSMNPLRSHRNIPSTCLPSIPGFQRQARVTHVVLLDDPTISSFVYDLYHHNNKDNDEILLEKQQLQQQCAVANYSKTNNNTCSATSTQKQLLTRHEMSQALSNQSVYFSFSKTKGLALLTPRLDRLTSQHSQYPQSPSPPYYYDYDDPATATNQHQQQQQQQIVAVSQTDPACFGEPFLQHAVFYLLGPDLVMINWLLAISDDGTGYIYNPRFDRILDLTQHAILNFNFNFNSNWNNLHNTPKNNENSNNNTTTATSNLVAKYCDFLVVHCCQWFRLHSWASKIRTMIKTCLIYFISTNLVSFLLQVAQERLLDLFAAIQSHTQENLSVLPLLVTHVADCFVFIPITIGVLYYLLEFYQGDWVICVTVLAIIFVCELFSFVSVRTTQGMFFFPRTFFLLFCLVHFYIFSFPFGFSHVALGMIVCFMLQCVTFFWNRYEVPAVALGLVPTRSRRMDVVAGSTTTTSSRDNALQYESSRESSPRSRSSDDNVVADHHQQRGAEISSILRGSAPTFPVEYSSSSSNNPDQLIRVSLQPQYHQQPSQHQQQQQIRYTYSSGAFSQGIMSRASSEAILHAAASADGDDGSESCVYFLGGEVVIRRGGGGSSGGGDTTPTTNIMNSQNNTTATTSAAMTLGTGESIPSVQMNRYDSASTLHSSFAQIGAGCATDEATPSGLQVIYDLTPRLCNNSRPGSSATSNNNTNSGSDTASSSNPSNTISRGPGPMVPTLESSSQAKSSRRQENE